MKGDQAKLVRQWGVAACLVAAAILSARPVIADESTDSRTADAPVATGAQADAPAPAAADGLQGRAPGAEPADRDHERQRAYTLGMVMIGGILICGVGLIAVVLLWGNRMRRIARQPLPRVAPRDELWYLKHKSGGSPESDAGPKERETPPA